MRKWNCHPRRAWALVSVLLVLLGLTWPSPSLARERAKNVIVLIADGCSAEQYTFARWFKGQPLSFDSIRTGSIKTFIADSVIADSAPAASAFSTGVRTSDKFISVGPHEKTMAGVPALDPGLPYRPLATVLEGARLLGKATGIVATSRVTHATPAAYVAHVHDRDMEDDIMEQAVHLGVDVVFGGGRRHLLPKDDKASRNDNENLLEVLMGKGYATPGTRDEMQRVRQGKAFGLFAPSHMDAEIDRPNLHPEQPTLEEMTRKAIELLSGDPDGFFLMVEGSQVDWACHANDPSHLLSDLLAFDRAVEAALDFARKDRKTLVLVFSDHNTGGFSIGNSASDKSYSQMNVDSLLVPFRKMKASADILWKRLGQEKTPAALKKVIGEGWGMEITDEDADQVLSLAARLKKDKLEEYYALGEFLSPRYTYVGWTTHGHCGGDVPLHAFGPGRPLGVLDGPEVAKACAQAMDLDLGKLNQRLFVDAGRVFGEGAVRIDKTDPQNPVVTIRHEGRQAELPVNKNWLILEGKARTLEGVVVYAPKKERAYIPLQAEQWIRGSKTPLPGVRAR
ncbi:MAG: alkaline phosphatase [Thermodesulfobacteriota bacterium]